MERKEYFLKRDLNLDYIQYIISIIISILFALGLIPFFYINLVTILIILIIIQLVLSATRFRIMNIILELILLILSIFSIIPIIGFLTRFFGMLIGIIDTSTFKNYAFYEKIEIITINKFKDSKFGSKSKFSKSRKGFNSNNFRDAEFKEK